MEFVNTFPSSIAQGDVVFVQYSGFVDGWRDLGVFIVLEATKKYAQLQRTDDQTKRVFWLGSEYVTYRFWIAS